MCVEGQYPEVYDNLRVGIAETSVLRKKAFVLILVGVLFGAKELQIVRGNHGLLENQKLTVDHGIL